MIWASSNYPLPPGSTPATCSLTVNALLCLRTKFNRSPLSAFGCTNCWEAPVLVTPLLFPSCLCSPVSARWHPPPLIHQFNSLSPTRTSFLPLDCSINLALKYWMGSPHHIWSLKQILNPQRANVAWAASRADSSFITWTCESIGLITACR